MKTRLGNHLKRMFRAYFVSSMLGLSSISAMAQVPNEIGTVSIFKQKFTSKKTAARSANVVSLPASDQVFNAVVNASYNNSGYETYAGSILNHGRSEFHVQFVNGKAQGLIILFDEKKAYEFYTTESGQVGVKSREFDKTISVDPYDFSKQKKGYLKVTAGTEGTTASGEVIPSLQSNPSASTVVYLDFDGEYVGNTPWNGGVAIDADKPYGTAENIRTIWEMVSEDYAPFNLNVTTDRSVYNNAAPGRRQMVVFTPTSTAAPGSGGVAYVGGFAWQPDLPCWVFISPLDAANSAEAASHEVGHTFGLWHDGRELETGHEEYYGGHNNWGPIMGVAYGRSVSHFSKGEYAQSSNTEDDFSIITSSANAFGYKNDDHGSVPANATQLLRNNNAFQAAGLIGNSQDLDYFRFSAPGGLVTIHVNNKYTSNSNLNVQAQILNSNLQVVATSNPSNTLSASFVDQSLAAGDYYLVIDGVGEGTPSTGYSDYGSLGEYTISAIFTNVSGCNTPAWVSSNVYLSGNEVSYNSNKFRARWWTQGNVPGAEQWGPWELLGPCGSVQVDPTVSITSPTNGQTMYQYPEDASPIIVSVLVNSSQTTIDSVKYVVVEVTCNGPGCTTVKRSTVTAAPYSLSYIPSLIGTGYTEVTAIAFSHGVASQPSVVQYYAKPLPLLSFIAPVNNSNVSKNASNVLIDVAVNDQQMLIDSVVYTVLDTKVTGPVGQTTTRKFVVTSPFDFSLPVIGGNTHTTIYALAYGDGGKFSRSKSVQINYNEVPTVFITSPSSSFKYNEGGSVTIEANVGDVDGTISTVEIYSPHIPNSSVILTAPPYRATFNNMPSSGIRGATSFVVKATDNQGGINGASVDVLENKKPTVVITSPVPVNGINPKYLVGGAITISADILDQDGSIVKVEFKKGGSSVGMVTVTSAPYTATFTNLPAPSPDGSYWFNVIAYDDHGATTDKLVVVYKNRVPSVTISSPTNNSTYPVGSTFSITSLIYDPDFVSGKVEFFNGSVKLGEATTAPYEFTVSNALAGVYNYTAKVTDDMGESATSSVIVVNVQNNTCTVAPWNASTTYNAPNRVSLNNVVYEAKWWTLNQNPSTNSGQWDVWKVIGPCSNSTMSPSSSGMIYPNPFANELNVSVDVLGESALVRLMDVHGNIVLQRDESVTMNHLNIVLNTSLIPEGIYTLQITSGSQLLTFRVSK